MGEQGFVEKPPTKKSTRRTGKVPHKAKARSKEPTRSSIVDPALKKVEKLGEIAAELRQGKDFSITRLTVLKGLCEQGDCTVTYAPNSTWRR